ncbi:MAG: 4Fe-4S dicluster domain-containing protein [Spirochaetia bacterium]|jgi:electron transport complex protein RnfC|nr:4Fe-4S dicluster domain-containing protein [Spirochaetia bacterium]
MKLLNGKISGGYELKQFKGQPSQELIVQVLPEHLYIPLSKTDTKIKPFVRTGDKVSAGQIIWQDDDSVSSPIHSSVNGIVESVKKMDYLEQQVSVVKITSTDSTELEKVPGFTNDWRKLGGKDLEKIIYLSGTSSLGSSGIPTGFKSSVIEPEDVQHIIIHSTDSEVFNPDVSVFLKDDGVKKFTEGLSILAKIMGKASIHIAMSTNTSTWFQVIDNAVSDNLSISFHKTKAKYPQSHDSVLAKTVLNIDIPANYKGINKGIVILGIQDVCHVYEAVVEGKPLTEKIVALAGPVFNDNIHLSLKVGTLISDISTGRLLLEDKEDIRFINNSVLTGKKSNFESPIGRNTEVLIALEEKRGQDLMFFAKPGFKKDSFSNTFLAKILPFKKTINTNLNGEQRACLSCGFCQNVCPAGILPNVLFPYVERDRLDETAVQYGIFKCIDCNLCTYVCTAKIPIAAYLKEGKKKLLEDAYVKEDDFINSYNLIGLKAGRQQVGCSPMQPKEQTNEAAE